jgi:ubiquinone/menaquinone biosynthesis C-methylase UbiE
MNTKVDIDTCDMYEFMNIHVGLSVLHPGGKKATDELIALLSLDKSTKVLEIGSGTGITAISLAKKYGCNIIGIDINNELVNKANYAAINTGVSHLVSFKVGDARHLDFKDEQFDIVFSQAILVLIDDNEKQLAIREVKRVLNNGGISAWSELSWGKEPTREFLTVAAKQTCSKGISNATTFEGWKTLLSKAGLKNIQVKEVLFQVRGIFSIIEDEGIKNGIRIMWKYIVNKKIRNRMRQLSSFFAKYPEYLGYGIYLGSK